MFRCYSRPPGAATAAAAVASARDVDAEGARRGGDRAGQRIDGAALFLEPFLT